MSRFKLILAVSADGYCARGAQDDMTWTGSRDKFLFKLLTTVDGQPLLAGRNTAAQMPTLPRRKLVTLRSSPRLGFPSLAEAAGLWPDAWLIGGPTVALAALERGLVQRAYINRVPAKLGEGISFMPIEERITGRRWLRAKEPDVDGSVLEVYWDINSGS